MAAKLPELQYGRVFNRVTFRRLEKHFTDAVVGTGPTAFRALVVGLFGEWGSGKTLHLRHIQQGFEDRLRTDLSRDEAPDILTVPVFFSAWCFEAEEHLIIPLLKTTRQRLRRLAAEQESHRHATARTWSWLKAKTKHAGDVAAALAYGFKGQLDSPGGRIEFDPTKAWAEYEYLMQARQTFVDGPSSPYFDFETEITRLTGYNSGDDDRRRLNLLFLIDDLDRCLPEKALRMLESIKPFLDIRGCAFVLALDDEVIKRSIAWRYRDYGSDRERDENRETWPANPITGHEDLERIVQLPMRIPVPSGHEVENYLTHHFGHLFG